MLAQRFRNREKFCTLDLQNIIMDRFLSPREATSFCISGHFYDEEKLLETHQVPFFSSFYWNGDKVLDCNELPDGRRNGNAEIKGKPRTESVNCNFRKGLLHGRYKSTFPVYKCTSFECNFEEGKPHGRMVRHNPAFRGRVTLETFSHGKRMEKMTHSTQKRYVRTKDGKVLRIKTTKKEKNVVIEETYASASKSTKTRSYCPFFDVKKELYWEKSLVRTRSFSE
ncbi:hypothetical protein [Brazilian marseillevirus]|uniref:hypothetical protein n=1 Tax=Brazilian marseillevirus TaxID=1813599 RepID=UPI000783CE79|nr:hypothetical protein A3303_gp130 [Brazilian marseillevirus]AMQ10638.1 hypothetical protein [Brazilian marseillevirus]